MNFFRTWPAALSLGWIGVVALSGCFSPQSEPCSSTVPCAEGLSCVEGRCVGATGGGTSETGGGAAGGMTAGGATAGGDGAGGGATGGGDGTGGGATAGGATAGGATAGGATAGGATAGGATAGGATAGGATAGGATAGGTGGGNTAGGSVPGDTCNGPIVVTSSGVLMGTTVFAHDDYAPTPGACKQGDGPEVVYAVTLPAGHRLDVVATPLSAWDVSLNLVADAAACGGASAMQCLASADGAGARLAERLSFLNTGASRQLLLVVDGYDSADLGDFSLNVLIQPLQAGDTCSAPVPLTSGVALTSQPLSGFASDYGPFVSGRCLFSNAIDRVYSVLVPAGQRLSATVTPVGFDSTLNLVRGVANCTMQVCEAGADQGGSSGPDSLTWDNRGMSAETVFLIVEGQTAPVGTFTIEATVSSSPPFIAGGSSCSAPVALDAGTYSSTTAGRTNGFGFSQQGGCLETSDAPDTVFSVTVPPNSMSLTTVTGAGWDVVLNVAASATGCGFTLDAGITVGATCIAASDGPLVESVERVTLRNPSATPMTALLVVDGLDGDLGSFTISHDIMPLSALVGDTCQTPQVLAMSGSLTGLTTVGYFDDVQTGSGCTGYQNRGSDRVFRVSVPAGQQLTASVIPNGWDAALYLLDPVQCGLGATCLDGSDHGSGPETARFTNAGTTARDVLIVVDAARPSTSGTFDLFTSIAP